MLLPPYIDGTYGFIVETGQVSIEPRFDEANGFVDDRALVLVAGSYGFIDPSGAFAIEPRFEEATTFSEGALR
jgi:hypothetical protein